MLIFCSMSASWAVAWMMAMLLFSICSFSCRCVCCLKLISCEMPPTLFCCCRNWIFFELKITDASFNPASVALNDCSIEVSASNKPARLPTSSARCWFSNSFSASSSCNSCSNTFLRSSAAVWLSSKCSILVLIEVIRFLMWFSFSRAASNSLSVEEVFKAINSCCCVCNCARRFSESAFSCSISFPSASMFFTRPNRFPLNEPTCPPETEYGLRIIFPERDSITAFLFRAPSTCASFAATKTLCNR